MAVSGRHCCLSATGKWLKQRNSCSCTLIVSQVAYSLAVNEAQSAKGASGPWLFSHIQQHLSNIWVLHEVTTFQCSRHFHRRFFKYVFIKSNIITFNLLITIFKELEKIYQNRKRRTCYKTHRVKHLWKQQLWVIHRYPLQCKLYISTNLLL